MKKNAPLRFVSSTVSQSPSDIRRLKPSRVTPALLTRMSTRSKSVWIVLATAAMPAGSLTSAA